MMDSIEVSGVKFTQRFAGDDKYVLHTKGVDGLTLLLSIRRKSESEWVAEASHWLNKVEHRDDSLRIHHFTLPDPFPSAKAAADAAMGISFRRVEVAGIFWIVASSGDAAALDFAGETIKVFPYKDGNWGWARECKALEDFSGRIGDSTILDGAWAPDIETAMIEAAAAKERLRGAVAELAIALGIRVAS
jgi:hypothetical protein